MNLQVANALRAMRRVEEEQRRAEKAEKERLLALEKAQESLAEISTEVSGTEADSDACTDESLTPSLSEIEFVGDR
jgi:hypothetical protein